jgi:hypothetical protein
MSNPTLPYDEPLTPDEQSKVNRLRPVDVEKIDQAILASVVPHWRKLARVVTEAMEKVEREFPDVPDLFYSQRAMVLAERGLLESQGNLRRMRYSEVRIPQTRET